MSLVLFYTNIDGSQAEIIKWVECIYTYYANVSISTNYNISADSTLLAAFLSFIIVDENGDLVEFNGIEDFNLGQQYPPSRNIKFNISYEIQKVTFIFESASVTYYKPNSTSATIKYFEIKDSDKQQVCKLSKFNNISFPVY